MSYVKKFPQEVEKRLLAMKEAEEETRKSMASPKVAVPTCFSIFLCHSGFSSRSNSKKRPWRKGSERSNNPIVIECKNTYPNFGFAFDECGGEGGRSGRYASESVFEISSGDGSSERSKQKKRRRSRSRQKKQKRRGRRRKRKRVIFTEWYRRDIRYSESINSSEWSRSRR